MAKVSNYSTDFSYVFNNTNANQNIVPTGTTMDIGTAWSLQTWNSTVSVTEGYVPTSYLNYTYITSNFDSWTAQFGGGKNILLSQYSDLVVLGNGDDQVIVKADVWTPWGGDDVIWGGSGNDKLVFMVGGVSDYGFVRGTDTNGQYLKITKNGSTGTITTYSVGSFYWSTGATTLSISSLGNNLPTGSVTIAGTTAQGQTLTATNTLADADGRGTITYTWKANGTSVGTGATYTLTQAEVGKTITATASYTDGYGTAESKSSSATSAIANVNDLPTGAVTITGTATQGQTLTATNSLADADGLGTIAYTWKANGTTVGTGANYTLTQAEILKTITVTASYVDGFGVTETVTSSATSFVIGWLQFGLQFTRASTNTKWTLSSYGNIENPVNTDTSYFVAFTYGDTSDPLYGLFNALWNYDISSTNVTLDPTSKQVGVSMGTWTYTGTMHVSGDIASGAATAFSNSETLNDRLFDQQKIIGKTDGSGFYLIASTILAPTYKRGLYLSEFASDGRETHSPLLISNNSALTTLTNSSLIIDVVQTNTGLIVLYSTNGSNLNIAKLSISNGTITSASFSDVSSDVSGLSMGVHNAAVVETSSGQIAVGFTQYVNNTFGLENLYLQTFDSQLRKLSNYQVSSASLDSQGAAQTPYYGGIDLIATGADYKLVWALQWNMKSATVSSSGTVVKSDFLLDTSVEKSSSFIFDPQVIKYSDNSYVVGWKVSGGFYVKSFDTSGHAIGPATFVATPNGGDVYAIDLGTTNDQNLIVQYQTSVGINVAKFANHSNTTYYSKTLLATDSDGVVVDASVAKNATMFTLSSGDYLITNLDMVSAPTEPSGPLSIIGTLSADTLTGGRFNDTLSGMGGNDTLIGNAGNDDITGDSADISVYSGNLSNYTISASNGLITIADNRTGSSYDGTDTLRGINLLKFADGMEFVGLAAQRVALTGSEVNHTIQVTENKLYSGTNAAEKFVIGSNVSSMILAGEGDTVHLAGSFTDYIYASRGSELQITKGDFMTTVNLAGNVSIETDLGHGLNAKLDFTQATPRVMLDTQLVTAGSIDATLLNTHATYAVL